MKSLRYALLCVILLAAVALGISACTGTTATEVPSATPVPPSPTATAVPATPTATTAPATATTMPATPTATMPTTMAPAMAGWMAELPVAERECLAGSPVPLLNAMDSEPVGIPDPEVTGELLRCLSDRSLAMVFILPLLEDDMDDLKEGGLSEADQECILNGPAGGITREALMENMDTVSGLIEASITMSLGGYLSAVACLGDLPGDAMSAVIEEQAGLAECLAMDDMTGEDLAAKLTEALSGDEEDLAEALAMMSAGCDHLMIDGDYTPEPRSGVMPGAWLEEITSDEQDCLSSDSRAVGDILEPAIGYNPDQEDQEIVDDLLFCLSDESLVRVVALPMMEVDFGQASESAMDCITGGPLGDITRKSISHEHKDDPEVDYSGIALSLGTYIAAIDCLSEEELMALNLAPNGINPIACLTREDEPVDLLEGISDALDSSEFDFLEQVISLIDDCAMEAGNAASSEWLSMISDEERMCLSQISVDYDMISSIIESPMGVEESSMGAEMDSSVRQALMCLSDDSLVRASALQTIERDSGRLAESDRDCIASGGLGRIIRGAYAEDPPDGEDQWNTYAYSAVQLGALAATWGCLSEQKLAEAGMPSPEDVGVFLDCAVGDQDPASALELIETAVDDQDTEVLQRMGLMLDECSLENVMPSSGASEPGIPPGGSLPRP